MTRQGMREAFAHDAALFAVEPELESEVRNRFDTTLRSSWLVGPGGVITTWRLQASEREWVLDEERDHVGRLVAS